MQVGQDYLKKERIQKKGGSKIFSHFFPKFYNNYKESTPLGLPLKLEQYLIQTLKRVTVAMNFNQSAVCTGSFFTVVKIVA